MAWTEKLPSGLYRGGYRDAAQRKKYTKPPRARKSDARQDAVDAEALARRSAALDAGTLAPRTTWAEWWETIKDKRGRADTHTSKVDENIVRRYIMPRWEREGLNKITQASVQSWVNDLTAGNDDGWEDKSRKPEPTYVRRIYSVFRSTMKQAVKDKILTASPCVGITLPRKRKKKKEFLDAERSAIIGTALRKDYHDAIELGLETGMRPGELCGLHANNVDLTRRTIWVCEVIVDRKKLIKPFPKDDDAREIPLTTKAMEIITRALEGRDLTKGCGLPHSDGTVCNSPLVLVTMYGKRVSPGQLLDRLRYVHKQHGLPKTTPYATRRGFATKAADGGVDAFLLAEALGHATLETAQEYVQQSQHAFDKLRAALGDRVPLAPVDDRGAHGAARGADLSENRQEGAGVDSDQKAG